jgi:DivIVA domain-containing protein
MANAEDSPAELASWLEQAWRQLRPAGAREPGFGRQAVDEYVTDILARVRSGERLDPYEIRMAPQFPVTVWSAAYAGRDVLTLRAELADRVLRSPSVSTEALATRADVPKAALELAELVRAARFRCRRRAGYDQHEVDEYLITLEKSLRRGESMNGAEIRARQFNSTKKFGPSYVEHDVRQLLENVARYADSAW